MHDAERALPDSVIRMRWASGQSIVRDYLGMGTVGQMRHGDEMLEQLLDLFYPELVKEEQELNRQRIIEERERAKRGEPYPIKPFDPYVKEVAP